MPNTELSLPGALEMLLLRAKRSKGLKRPNCCHFMGMKMTIIEGRED